MNGGSILIVRGETKTPSEFANFIAKRKKMSPEQIKKVSFRLLFVLVRSHQKRNDQDNNRNLKQFNRRTTN